MQSGTAISYLNAGFAQVQSPKITKMTKLFLRRSLARNPTESRWGSLFIFGGAPPMEILGRNPAAHRPIDDGDHGRYDRKPVRRETDDAFPPDGEIVGLFFARPGLDSPRFFAVGKRPCGARLCRKPFFLFLQR
jgi:hypothetical protein